MFHILLMINHFEKVIIMEVHQIWRVFINRMIKKKKIKINEYVHDGDNKSSRIKKSRN